MFESNGTDSDWFIGYLSKTLIAVQSKCRLFEIWSDVARTSKWSIHFDRHSYLRNIGSLVANIIFRFRYIEYVYKTDLRF